jgi:thiamine-monophosphate kinase
MGEFELIRRYFSSLTTSTEGVVLGIGDDAAILAVANGEQLVVTVDTSNADVHFPADADAFAIGYRALAVNLSDLAAMGALPRWFTLSLTLPSVDEDWLAQFARGLAALANEHGVALVGGDTTRGALAISIQAMGTVPAGQALKRAGAQQGDLVCVSGSIGDAAAGLACYRDAGAFSCSEADREFLLDRYLRPTPRIALGFALRGVANSCIDISDGLLADVGHIADCSGVGVCIAANSVPASAALLTLPASQRLSYQLTGGDDYELCFTVPSSRMAQLDVLAADLGVRITRIGEVGAGTGVICVDAAGQQVVVNRAGFQHF